MNPCVIKLFKAGEISPEVFAQYEQKAKQNKIDFDSIKTERETAQTKYQENVNTASKRQTLVDNIKSTKTAKEAFDSIADLITKPKGMGKDVHNIEYKIKQIHADVLQPLAKHFDTLISKMGGLKINKKLLDNITLEVFQSTAGKSGSKEAKDVVKAMNEVLVKINDQIPEGSIKVDNLSQLAPLSNKVAGMTKDQFAEIVRPLVRGTDLEIKNLIDTNYQRALDGEEIGSFPFKTADDMVEYQKKIGGDAFSSLINYIDRQSAQIASKGILGKYPENTIKALAKEGKLSENETSQLLNMYQNASGNTNQKQPISLSTYTAAIISATRAIGTAAMIGSSPLTGLLDIATMGITAKFNGIPLMPMYGQMLKNLVSKASRMELAQVGFQLESILSSLSHTSKWNPHTSTNDILNKIATGVLRISGLLAMSDSMKLAVKNTFLITFKDLEKSTFEGLIKKNPKMYKQLKQYGINKDDWDTMRKSIGDDIKLDPLKLTNMNNDVGSKFFKMINEEADYAVVTPGSRSSYWTSLGQDKGSLAGESIKSITQFKSTIVEQITTHLYRAGMQQGVNNKLGYAAQYFVATTILGYMVHQLKEVSKGRTIEDITRDPKASLADAMRQGGAIPILTDNIIPNMMDPQYGQGKIEDILSMASMRAPLEIAKNIPAGISGEDKAQAKIAKNVMGMTPGQNIWYLKAFAEYAKSYVAYLIDPASERKKQRRINTEMRKKGQKKVIEL